MGLYEINLLKFGKKIILVMAVLPFVTRVLFCFSSSSILVLFFVMISDKHSYNHIGSLSLRSDECGDRITNLPVGNISISYCLFEDFSGNNEGGTIYIRDIEVNLSLSDSTFYHCGVINRAGAIFFTCSTNSSISLTKVCANNCYAYYGHFALIESYHKYNSTWDYNSICNCSNDAVDECMITLSIESSFDLSGRYYFSNNNLSDNRAYYQSCLRIALSLVCIMKYCTFSHNHAINEGFTTMVMINHGFTISSSNFVSNTQQNEGPGMIAVRGKSFICYFLACIFSKNSNYLLEISEDSTLSLQSCIIDHNPNNFTKGTITVELNNTVSLFPSIETYSIIHLKTYLCHAEIPMPTPTIYQTPDFTPIETACPTEKSNTDISPRANVVIISIVVVTGIFLIIVFIFRKKEMNINETPMLKPYE